MTYQIVEANTFTLLESKVSKQIMNRWTPQGGVCVGVDGSFYQAMIKEDKYF